jgi:sugar lactone lactonase YvrE
MRKAHAMHKLDWEHEKGSSMRQPFLHGIVSKISLAACVAALAGTTLAAQVPTALPIPFARALAGTPTGGTTTTCTTTLPTAAGVSLVGDGCPAANATMSAPYSATVDSYGNVYFSDYNDYALRVIYNGGVGLAAAIQAANPTQTIVPQVGYVYTLAGSRSAALASTQGATGKAYYCNGAGTGQIGQGSNGDACPATYAYLKPRGAAVDANGNVFFASASGSAPVRVVYVGGTQVANLIATLYPGTVAQVGFIYSIVKSSTSSYKGDGLTGSNAGVGMYAERDVALDSAGNIYVSDGTNSFTAPAYASNNDVRVVNGVTGIISTYAGSAGCAQGSTTGCAGVYGGDGGPATSATFNSPYTIFFDKYDNLYITDYNDGRLRVVYQGGSVPGLGSSLTPGYVYTVAGGGTLTASGSLATQLSLGTIYVGGIDVSGNLYIADGTSRLMWRIDAKTGVAIVIAGGKSGKLGVACNGSTSPATGPVSTDGLGDGCPGPQGETSPSGKLTFDKFGNFYMVESGNNVLREFSYNTLFPATVVGVSVAEPLAFTSVPGVTLTGENFSIDGGTTTAFSDAGGDTCSLNTLCVFNVKFAPSQAGLRKGSLQFNAASGTATSYFLGGAGIAANTSVDPASTSTLGSGLTPAGVFADSNGSVYIADSGGNKVVRVASSGGTANTLISGLSKPGQVAVDGAGDVFVADSGNNRIASVSASSSTVVSLGTGLSKPQGVAADNLGDVYVADTGNNRVVELPAGGGQVTLNITGLSSPTRVAVDGAGDLFVVDSGNARIVELPIASEATTINLGTTTIAPTGIAVDAAGDLYIADTASQSVVEFAPGSVNGNQLVTGLTSLKDVAVDLNGSLYVADSSQSGVIAANRALPTTDFPNTNLNTSNSATLNVTNTGNAALTFTGPQLTTATGNTTVFSVAAASSNGCSTTVPVAPGSACGLNATFTPAAKGNFSENVSLVTNAANVATSGAVLTGTGVFLVSTSTAIAVTSPTTPTINYSEAVTVSITVTPASNAGAAPTGTVKLTVDGKLQTQTLPANGVVTVTLNPAVGTHAVSASYGGDTLYASSSNSFSFTVLKAVTTTTLSVTVGQQGTVPNLTFASTVSSTTATGETGTVSFYYGTPGSGTLISSANVNASGQASYTTQTTTYGSYSFYAVYVGDSNFATSTSVVNAPSPNFTVVPTATAITIPQGGVASINTNITPLYNYSGTVSATCSGLPANSVCRFQPSALAIGSATAQPYTIFIYTNVQSTLASMHAPASGGHSTSGIYLAEICGWPFAAVVLFCFGRRRRLARRMPLLSTIALLMAMGAGFGALSGCSSGTTASPAYVTPQGTSALTVTFTDTGGVTHAVAFSFTVTAPYALP